MSVTRHHPLLLTRRPAAFAATTAPPGARRALAAARWRHYLPAILRLWAGVAAAFGGISHISHAARRATRNDRWRLVAGGVAPSVAARGPSLSCIVTTGGISSAFSYHILPFFSAARLVPACHRNDATRAFLRGGRYGSALFGASFIDARRLRMTLLAGAFAGVSALFRAFPYLYGDIAHRKQQCQHMAPRCHARQYRAETISARMRRRVPPSPIIFNRFWCAFRASDANLLLVTSSVYSSLRGLSAAFPHRSYFRATSAGCYTLLWPSSVPYL